MTDLSYIYILTNNHNTTLYIGVTSNLPQRIFTHKEKINEGFSKQYNLTKLVYYEACSDIEQAILREKQLNGGSRQKKIDLIDRFNTEWLDL
jgi:putative endonuclease